MDRREIIIKQITKYGIFVFSVFVLYIFQSTPGFLQIFGIKPVFIIPFCTTLAMTDESEHAAVVYFIGGILTDLSRGRVNGTFAIMLLTACFLAVIAVKFVIKPTARNFFYYAFGSMVIMFTIEFIFSFIMGGMYTNKLLYYIKNVLLVSLYSAVFSNLFYRFIDFINMRFLRFDAR